jgi:DNA-directed RNA polymerase specialized sigma24 family protein
MSLLGALLGDTVQGFVLIDQTKTDSFTEFVANVESKLRHALTASFGVENGREALAEALAYGWEHWEHIQGMDNPGGYLYRVAHNHANKALSSRNVIFPEAPLAEVPWVEPGLPEALARLSERQRVAVYLVHGQEWSTSEVSDFLGVSKTTVQKHVERGMKKLRRQLDSEG